MDVKAIVLGFILPFSAIGQEIITIDQGMVGLGPCEPSIAISNQDPSIQVAGSILDRVYVSQDSGATWTMETLESEYGVYGDPVIVSERKNRFFYLHLSDPAGKGWSDPSLLDRIVVQRSNRKAKKWTVDSYVGLNEPKDQDKQWAAYNEDEKTLYCTWTQFDLYGSKEEEHKSSILFAMSRNSGRSWTSPIAINQYAGDCLDDDRTVEGAVPAFNNQGDVFVAWAYDEKIYFDRSNDGENWLDTDIVIAEQPGGWTQQVEGLGRANGMPVLNCDRSNGQYEGRLYVNWTDRRDGDINVMIAYSDDKGDTWSEPIRVNQDLSGKDQFYTWMTVDQSDGSVYCVYYDRRKYPDQRTLVYLARSTDGGVTWGEQPITQEPFIPEEGIFFGDYNNISAVEGVVRPIWTEYSKEVGLSVKTALFNF